MADEDIDDEVQVLCNGYIPTSSENWGITCDTSDEYDDNEEQ